MRGVTTVGLGEAVAAGTRASEKGRTTEFAALLRSSEQGRRADTRAAALIDQIRAVAPQAFRSS
jgi:hypothetical protein